MDLISIIVCSRNKKLPDSFIDNIQFTIGYVYELIVIDNSNSRYSIFEAYNIGLEQSAGEIICFIHDDILIHTQAWGEVLRKIFSADSKIGLIGIAGAKVKSKMPSAWWECSLENCVLNILQHNNDGKIEKHTQGFTSSSMEEVVVIDGVFMAMRKIAGIGFNETIPGFHNYDLNLSFEIIRSGYKVMVTKDVLIEHFSQGKINKEWFRSAIKVHNLYFGILPLNKISIDKNTHEFYNGKKFISDALFFSERFAAWQIWFKLFLIDPFSKSHLLSLKKFTNFGMGSSNYRRKMEKKSF